jgi:hypothetical protein
MSQHSIVRRLVSTAFVIALGTIPAPALALDIFNIPILKNIDGPVVWVSQGWIRNADGSAPTPEYWRGGLGVRYHTLTWTGKYDSTLTTIERVASDGKVTVKQVYTYEKNRKSGPISISIGYAVDNGFRLNARDFNVRLPLKGPYVGVFVVPSRLQFGNNSPKTGRFQGFVGGTVALLDVRETSVVIDTVALKLNSSQFPVPEAFVGLSHGLGGKVVGFVELSWEYARLQSIGYDKASLSGIPSTALVQRLPRTTSFHALNVTIGVTFARV